MYFESIKSLIDKLAKDEAVQPTVVRLPLFFVEVESEKYLADIINQFDFFINTGTTHPGDNKPECVKHLVGLNEFNAIGEVLNNDSPEDVVDKIKNNKLSTHLATGETLGSLWTNHEHKGNQINNLITEMINGIKTYYMLNEAYFGDDESLNINKMKNALSSDYTFVYIEGEFLNMNLSLHDADLEEIVYQHALRFCLAKFITSSPKMKNIKIGNINIFLNNFDVNIPYNPIVLKRLSLFVPEGHDYPEQYYFGESVNLSECLK